MALPTSGPSITLKDIADEFGDSAPHGLSEFYRGGPLVGDYAANANVPTTGAIGLNNFYGASNRNVITVTITGSTTEYNAYANRSPQYFAGKTDITYVVNPGVTISSTATPSAAFIVPSEFNPGDTVTVVNNGTIQGRGGNGGPGGNASPSAATAGGAGGAGGTALQVSRPVTVQNSGSLLGGGGGGGGGGGAVGNLSFFPGDNSYTFPSSVNGGAAGGGGGGGGQGASSGGPGGDATGPYNVADGGNGTSAPLAARGAGGPAGASPAGGTPAFGGNGGSGGAVGANGSGGGPAQSGNLLSAGGGGGPSGNYITGNPFVTWATNGTRTGGVG